MIFEEVVVDSLTANSLFSTYSKIKNGKKFHDLNAEKIKNMIFKKIIDITPKT